MNKCLIVENIEDCAEWSECSVGSMISHNNIIIPTNLWDIELNYYHELEIKFMFCVHNKVSQTNSVGIRIS